MSLPAISTILATHNGAATIRNALASIAAQNYLRQQVILIDNGSSDTTASIIAKWCASSELSTRVIKNTTNIGLTRALNQGLAVASGSLIARIDDDDVWEPGKLAAQATFMSEHPAIGVVGTWYTNVRPGQIRAVELPVADASIRSSMWRRNPFGHSTVVMRKSVLETVGDYDEQLQYAQDRDLWFRLMPHTQFYNIPKQLVTRTVGATDTTKQAAQMKTNIQLIRKYAREYRASPTAYLGMVEPMAVLAYRTLTNQTQ